MHLGIATNIKLPEHMPNRSELIVEAKDLNNRDRREPEDFDIANIIKRSS